jgi:protein-tyrosine phosphatase
MNTYIANAGLSDKIVCDSAGTLAYHAGEPADSRMQKHAKKRNYNLTSISRKIETDDFEDFHYIIGMDDDNMHNMQPYIKRTVHANKMSKMTDYCANPNPGYVPDPYYGGDAGFEQVLDLLEDACSGLLQHIRNEHTL